DADLVWSLFNAIKARENLEIAAGNTAENGAGNCYMLAEDRGFFRRVATIGQGSFGREIGLLFAALYNSVDMRGYLPAHYRAHKPHEPFGVTQLAVTNGLHDDNEGVVNA